MQYRLLSKEQFDTLHNEFSKFLATQKIDKKEWDLLKATDSAQVQKQLNNFSDLVWEEVLRKTKHLEHFSTDSLNLFKCDESSISRIVVRVEKKNFDFQKQEDFLWFIDNSKDESIHYFKGKKEYKPTRSKELFDLIEKGAALSDSKLFDAISSLIKPT
jgi:hypothetical protein